MIFTSYPPTRKIDVPLAPILVYRTGIIVEFYLKVNMKVLIFIALQFT